jgi:L-fuconolactonase
MRVDAHHHFWKYDPIEYAWIGDKMKVIRRDFLPRIWKRRRSGLASRAP